MMRTPALLVSLSLLCLSTTTTAGTAAAVLHPSHAQADADAALREYPFCREPHEPLSSRALYLCPHAAAIPGCSGYATACAAAATTPPASTSTPWWARWLTLPPFIGMLAQGLVWLLVAALVIAVLIPIVRGIARMRRGQLPPDEKRRSGLPLPPVFIAPEVPTLGDEEQLLLRAQELAARGELTAAVQLYLLASLRALDKRGAVRITKDRTNGEYVRGCSDQTVKPVLRDLVREVDRVQFGGEAPTSEGVGRAAQRAVAIVRALPIAMLLLMLAFATGCSGMSLPKPRRTGDDPAGAEMLHDILSRQGVTLRGLDSSLATMPLPGPAERGPTVIVDLDRTSLDDDAREHLLAWVDAGGLLVLAGAPEAWPKELKASRTLSAGNKVVARQTLARAVPKGADDEADDDTDDDTTSAIYARDMQHGEVVGTEGLDVRATNENVAWFDDGTQKGTPYAAVIERGRGRFLLMASTELLTNAALARPGNAAVLVAILSSVSRAEMRLADVEDGVSPPSTPIAALLRAGLGLALSHAAIFAIVLFTAVGIRQARAKPAPPPRRRAFAEHIEAVGALYARAGSAPHALASYARFADERLHARLPRGSNDVAGFLASRARMPLDVCQRLWVRATQAKAGAPALGDELTVLRELRAVYAAAMAQDR